MAEDGFKDLERRVASALRISERLRRDTLRLLGMRGGRGKPGPRPETPDWPRIHGYLIEALSALDAGFDAPEWRLVRSRLIREATCACVHLRLRENAPLRMCLQAMLADAMRLPTGSAVGAQTIGLRRLIRLALHAAPPERATSRPG